MKNSNTAENKLIFCNINLNEQMKKLSIKYFRNILAVQILFNLQNCLNINKNYFKLHNIKSS